MFLKELCEIFESVLWLVPQSTNASFARRVFQDLVWELAARKPPCGVRWRGPLYEDHQAQDRKEEMEHGTVHSDGWSALAAEVTESHWDVRCASQKCLFQVKLGPLATVGTIILIRAPLPPPTGGTYCGTVRVCNWMLDFGLCRLLRSFVCMWGILLSLEALW